MNNEMKLIDEITKRLTAKKDEYQIKAKAARTRFNYKDAEMYEGWSSTIAEALIIVHEVQMENMK